MQRKLLIEKTFLKNWQEKIKKIRKKQNYGKKL